MFTFRPIQENTYLLWNEKGETIIIDPDVILPQSRKHLKILLKTKVSGRFSWSIHTAILIMFLATSGWQNLWS
jgi:hypothetical protein